jgi:TonB family protein
MLLVITLAGTFLGAAVGTPGRQGVSAAAPRSGCDQVLTTEDSGAAAASCRGEEALRRAEGTTAPDERAQLLRAAARQFRQAADLGRGALRTEALQSLARAFDRAHLNDPDSLEQVLGELLLLDPLDLSVVGRLARSQEERGMIEAAEQTLLTARTQQPDVVEPYRLLAQFYARRVTAMHSAHAKQQLPDDSKPGDRATDEARRVDGSFDPPVRRDRPVYPPEAKAAGIQGNVVVEVLIDEEGSVIDATVVRSIPLLDAEALRAVREWRFTPPVVNGKPTRVRMTTTVNFTLP